jgi:hypothetical protein
MTPFQHEVSMNQRMHQDRRLAEKSRSVDDWNLKGLQYVDVSRRGKLRPIGRTMLQQANLLFQVESDEVMDRPNF